MAVAKQQHSYQCDQCGSPNIVALSVLHEQGTRTYSSPTNWGSSQSYSAQGAAPPRRKGYGGPLLLWGFLLSFFLFWSWACYSAMFSKYPKTASSMEYPLGLLGLMVLGCVIGLVLTSRKVSRYNQAVFPDALLNVGAHIHVPPLRKAASYSFIIRMAAVEEQFPVGPAKGDAAAQFPQVFPTRMIRSRRQIVFEFGWCSPGCPSHARNRRVV